MKEEQQYKETEIDLNEIESCIDILNRLVNDTNPIFEIPEDRRIALIKAAGQLSRPSKQEFAKRVKDAKRNEKRKQAV
ncbi:MAG TPA: oxidoreductase, partial [Maribacter sp.]|nr:oxidoreductase [Maribacter sp.]